MIDIGMVLVFLTLLVLEMMFYGFNAALQNRSNADADDNEKKPDKKAERLQYMIDNPAKYSNAVQLGIVMINMLLGAFLLVRLYNYFWLFSVTAIKSIGWNADWQIKCFIVLTAIVVTVCMLYIVLTFGVLIPR